MTWPTRTIARATIAILLAHASAPAWAAEATREQRGSASGSSAPGACGGFPTQPACEAAPACIWHGACVACPEGYQRGTAQTVENWIETPVPSCVKRFAWNAQTDCTPGTGSGCYLGRGTLPTRGLLYTRLDASGRLTAGHTGCAHGYRYRECTPARVGTRPDWGCITYVETSIPCGADLAVRQIVVHPGATPPVAAVIVNSGKATAEPSATSTFTRSATGARRERRPLVMIGALDPGQETTVALPLTDADLPPSGACRDLKVCADEAWLPPPNAPAGAVREVDESNNCVEGALVDGRFVDARYAPALSVCCGGALPASFDWRSWGGVRRAPPVRDQGTAGSSRPLQVRRLSVAKVADRHVAVKRALACHGPLGAGTGAWPHAFLVVGWEPDPEGGERWIIEDSQGTGGFGTVPFAGHPYGDLIDGELTYVEGVP